MDKELLEKIEALENEIKNIKEKYGQIQDYKLISTIFDKLGVEYVEVTFDEVNNNNSIYIAERDSEVRKVFIRKENKDA